MADILLLCEYSTLCGGERSMLSTFGPITAAGFRLAVAGPPEGPLANALAAAGIKHIAFAVAGLDGRRQSQTALRNRLRSLLVQHRPNLLHANSLAMSRLAGPVAAEAGVPSIGHLRDIVKLSRQAIDDLNRHVRLLAVSDAVRHYHVEAGLDSPRTYVAYNGVDLAEFQPRMPTGYLHRELHLPAAVRLVGTIGQIGLRKGQDVLVEAAGILAPQFPDVHYLVVGQRNSIKQESADFEARLNIAARQGPLAGRLHLLGERTDVARILGELALLAHPARQEPLGRVLLEAAATGVAVVATNVGGTGEIFPADLNAAILVPPNQPVALSEAISRLLADDHNRRALGRAARARAESAFSASMAASSLAAHYAEIASARR